MTGAEVLPLPPQETDRLQLQGSSVITQVHKGTYNRDVNDSLLNVT